MSEPLMTDEQITEWASAHDMQVTVIDRDGGEIEQSMIATADVTAKLREMRDAQAELLAAAVADDWNDLLLGIHNAIVTMGTFAKPLEPELMNLTTTQWDLERAKRIAAAMPFPRADLETVLAFVERTGALLPGEEPPAHIHAALRLRAWLTGAT